MKYEIMTFSGFKLRKKLDKLASLGMVEIEVDVINLTGEVYLFQIPFCAN